MEGKSQRGAGAKAKAGSCQARGEGLSDKAQG